MISNFKTPKAMRIECTDGRRIMENIVGISIDDTWVTYVFIDDERDTYCRSIKAEDVKEVLLLEPKKEKDDLDKIREEWDEMFKDLFGDLM